MIQIRNGVFETNSSSTHSIAIPKKCDKIVNQVRFGLDEYGWENSVVYDTASYLYTAIMCAYNEPERIKKLARLTTILNTHGIAYTFEKPQWETYDSGYKVLANGYIDHAGETCDLVDALLDDEDMLIRYLSAGVVYTGNDNQEPRYDGCNICDDYIDDYDYEYDEDKKRWKEVRHIYGLNPYHDEENYDYFYKSN